MPVATAQRISAQAANGDKVAALRSPTLECALQPIVDIAGGRVQGHESLMRGYERFGFSSPLDLLDAAHRDNDLRTVERQIIGRAIDRYATLSGGMAGTLFVNVDSRLLADFASDVPWLLARLATAGQVASSLCLELSERFDNSAVPDIEDLIRTLKQAGFKLAIDDFGTGFSGLKLLCAQPVDYVKIDGYFVRDIDTVPRKRQVLRQAVQTAHALGSRVIAEGVETEAEFRVCRDLGCDLVQGYFVARPTMDLTQLRLVYPQLVKAGPVHKDHVSLDSMLIRAQIEQVPAARESDDIEQVFTLFRDAPHRSFFPVVAANGEPRGVINEHHVKAMIYHPFGRDLQKNHIYQRGIAHFTTPAPVADIDTPAADLLKIFTGTDGSDCVILTENRHYAGILSSASLLKIIHEKQLKTAQDQNPLTGLPGNRAIRDYVAAAALDEGVERALCYCDFDNFKPFNDRYGFQTGDRAITLFADLLRRHFPGEDVFLAHIGGDDFFVGARGDAVVDLRTTLAGLLEDFRREAQTFYQPEHVQAGFVTGLGRDGVPRIFPLMRCSAAVLVLQRGALLVEAADISTMIAEIKTRSKQSADGIVFDHVPPVTALAV